MVDTRPCRAGAWLGLVPAAAVVRPMQCCHCCSGYYRTHCLDVVCGMMRRPSSSLWRCFYHYRSAHGHRESCQRKCLYVCTAVQQGVTGGRWPVGVRNITMLIKVVKTLAKAAHVPLAPHVPPAVHGHGYSKPLRQPQTTNVPTQTLSPPVSLIQLR